MASIDVDKMHRELVGLTDKTPEDRAEWVLQQMLDGLHVGPNNRRTVKEYLASHFRYVHDSAYRAGIEDAARWLRTARAGTLVNVAEDMERALAPHGGAQSPGAEDGRD